MQIAEVVRRRTVTDRWPRAEGAGPAPQARDGLRRRIPPFAWGAVSGVTLAYLLDPDRGRRRRARLRDRSVRVVKQTERAVDAASEDLTNRARGLVYEARGRVRREEVDDELLIERVRSKLGQVVTHPGSIEVEAKDGVVILRGTVLADEVRRLLRGVRRVRGVSRVEDHLEVHGERGRVPGLQGSGRIPRPGENWSPRARVVGSLSGAGLAACGITMRDHAFGRGLGVAGSLLAIRSVTNLPLRRLVGIGARRRAIDIEKTINIDAPVERVFEFWTDYENFPKFMTHVREVKELGGDRSRWTVEGPAGIPVKFDAEVSAFRPNDVFGWRSAQGSAIEHAGIVRFQANRDGGTRVQVQMTYNPVAGALGHAFARLLGSDPKRRMDDDLMRMKSLIETGQPPSDASKPPAE